MFSTKKSFGGVTRSRKAEKKEATVQVEREEQRSLSYMTRKKPYSGKKKKVQLKAKRSKKRGDEDKVKDQYKGKGYTNFVGKPKHDAKGDGDPEEVHKLRTVFKEETKEEVQKRKLESQKPLERDQSRVADDYFYHRIIDMPKRPPWNYKTTKEELDRNENDAFKNWLQAIYDNYPVERLNYFEHNLEVWRQLWRVIERSDILVVVADCRHPLFHFPPSLYDYVVNDHQKPIVLLLNKIDLVPGDVVERWIDYFQKRYPKLKVAPFSSYPNEETVHLGEDAQLDIEQKRPARIRRKYNAAGRRELIEICASFGISRGGVPLVVPESLREEQENIARYGGKESKAEKAPKKKPATTKGGGGGGGGAQPKGKDQVKNLVRQAPKSKKQMEQEEDEHDEYAIQAKRVMNKRNQKQKKKRQQQKEAQAAAAEEEEDELSDEENVERKVEEEEQEEEGEEEGEEAGEYNEEDEELEIDEKDITTLEEDLDYASPEAIEDLKRNINYVTVGMIGHPNVGKSSLINGLVGRKVVSTSSTPGHTKYLQTIFLTKSIRLCDCPGLTFPAVDMPKPLQILLGLYPVAQVREPYSAIGFLAERIPLEKIYALKKSKKYGLEKEWSAFHIAERYAKLKGYRTRHGGLDTYRAGNEVLRDATEGRVVFFFYPPAQKEHYLPPKIDASAESLDDRVKEQEEEQEGEKGKKEEGEKGKKEEGEKEPEEVVAKNDQGEEGK